MQRVAPRFLQLFGGALRGIAEARCLVLARSGLARSGLVGSALLRRHDALPQVIRLMMTSATTTTPMM
jgi:hypothetical protein